MYSFHIDNSFNLSTHNLSVPITYNKRNSMCKFGELPSILISVYEELIEPEVPWTRTV